MKKQNHKAGRKRSLIYLAIIAIVVLVLSFQGCGSVEFEITENAQETSAGSSAEVGPDALDLAEEIEQELEDMLDDSEESSTEDVTANDGETTADDAMDMNQGQGEDDPAEEAVEEPVDDPEQAPVADASAYRFRNAKLLNQHYEKHGIEMGFDSAEEYELAAAEVVVNPSALHKTEEEDGDDIYYIEDTNEFVVISTDGYIRTYFLPSAGKSYYDRQ